MPPHSVPELELLGRRVLTRKAGDMFHVYMHPTRLRTIPREMKREQYVEVACSLIGSMGAVVRQRGSRRLYSRQSDRSNSKALMMSEIMALADSQIH